MTSPDTIVAIATPPGRGGIGVVRLSGPLARGIAEPILRLTSPLAPGRARFAHLLDPTALAGPVPPLVLDQAVVTFFAAPNSYTSEDVVEISLHGAPVLLEAVLRHTVASGARLAAPGEFTQRAYASGRLDLTAAEAVRDLIDASTLHQARVAAAQLGGSVSRAIAAPKSALVTLIATLEAGIDFAEDDIETLPPAGILTAIERVTTPLRALAGTFSYGRILREGVTVALAGQPNAGKSSLFNRLLGRDRAIVTPQPGTTRDLIAEQFHFGVIPVELVDTAGLRELPAEATHEAERAGIERTRFALAEAHHILLVIDATTLDPHHPTLASSDRETLHALKGRPTTLVFNKSDLLVDAVRAALANAFPDALVLSSTTGDGLPALRAKLESSLATEKPSDDTTLITSLRQQAAIERSLSHLSTATEGTQAGAPHEILVLDLHAALAALDELTGVTTAEAILQQIFSTFCIGK